MSARYDRWSVFADAVGGYAEEGVNERIPTQLCTLSVAATGKLRFAMSDFALGYQLGRWSLAGRWRPFSLGVYAGTRYMYFNVKLSARAGVVGAVQQSASASNSWAWADPLSAASGRAPISSGGLVGDVKYWLPWAIQPWLAVGYRAISFNRDFAGSNNIDLQFRGPTSGAGFVF